MTSLAFCHELGNCAEEMVRRLNLVSAAVTVMDGKSERG